MISLRARIHYISPPYCPRPGTIFSTFISRASTCPSTTVSHRRIESQLLAPSVHRSHRAAPFPRQVQPRKLAIPFGQIWKEGRKRKYWERVYSVQTCNRRMERHSRQLCVNMRETRATLVRGASDEGIGGMSPHPVPGSSYYGPSYSRDSGSTSDVQSIATLHWQCNGKPGQASVHPDFWVHVADRMFVTHQESDTDVFRAC